MQLTCALSERHLTEWPGNLMFLNFVAIGNRERTFCVFAFAHIFADVISCTHNHMLLYIYVCMCKF